MTIVISGSVYAWKQERLSPDVELHNTIEKLTRENQLLDQEVKQQTMNFQNEQAVRKSLEKQLADQGEELKKAQKDLSFFRSNSAR